jgi:hypothetical protein
MAASFGASKKSALDLPIPLLQYCIFLCVLSLFQ